MGVPGLFAWCVRACYALMWDRLSLLPQQTDCTLAPFGRLRRRYPLIVEPITAPALEADGQSSCDNLYIGNGPACSTADACELHCEAA